MYSSKTPRPLLAFLYLGGAVLFWGTSFVATKIALDSFPPMVVIWLRMLVASVAFAPFLRMLPRPTYRKGDWKPLLIAVTCIPCLYYLFEGYAIRLTTSSQAGVISAVVPLVVALGAWLVLGERLGWRGAVAIGLSLVGVAVLSIGGAAQSSAPNPALGNFLEMLAMVSAAGSMITVRYLGARYNAWLLTGLQALVGVVFFLPFLVKSNPAVWLSAPPVAWGCVVYLGLFVSLGAFGLYNSALSLMPAGRVSLSINLVPAVAVVSGWLLRGESLTPSQLAACILIVGAVVFGEMGPESDTETRERDGLADATGGVAEQLD
jgi:drug/metabolite transporter (DMT)-like permease